jgi:hypothetical protein
MKGPPTAILATVLLLFVTFAMAAGLFGVFLGPAAYA